MNERELSKLRLFFQSALYALSLSGVSPAWVVPVVKTAMIGLDVLDAADERLTRAQKLLDVIIRERREPTQAEWLAAELEESKLVRRILGD